MPRRWWSFCGCSRGSRTQPKFWSNVSPKSKQGFPPFWLTFTEAASLLAESGGWGRNWPAVVRLRHLFLPAASPCRSSFYARPSVEMTLASVLLRRKDYSAILPGISFESHNTLPPCCFYWSFHWRSNGQLVPGKCSRIQSERTSPQPLPRVSVNGPKELAACKCARGLPSKAA